MRIGVDARELGGKPTGVGTYLANLLREWSRMPEAEGHEWILYVPGKPAGRPEACVPRSSRWRPVPGMPGTWWEQRGLAAAVRGDRPDVFFAPGYSAPLAIRVPVVLAVHDVSFFAHPEWFHWREGLRRRLITGRSARQARTVLTISEFSKGEIAHWMHVPKDRIRVIYPGVACASVEEPERRQAARQPVVLFVGSIFNRRRVPDLMRAFASATRDNPSARLELVGDNRTHPREDLASLAASLGIADRTHLRSYVSDQELAALYRQASVFAFLSEYEGFGFTPLEALTHGVPSVVLDTPVAHEVYQGGALFVARGDIPATADALRLLLTDPALRAATLENGRRVIARYAWRAAARATLGVLEEAR